MLLCWSDGEGPIKVPHCADQRLLAYFNLIIWGEVKISTLTHRADSVHLRKDNLHNTIQPPGVRPARRARVFGGAPSAHCSGAEQVAVLVALGSG